MLKKRVVVSQSSVTAGQLKDLFRQIEDGTVGFDELGGFLESPKKFTRGKSTPIVRAINILGEKKVLTAEQAAKAWSV